jgi:hypothetical protein
MLRVIPAPSGAIACGHAISRSSDRPAATAQRHSAGDHLRSAEPIPHRIVLHDLGEGLIGIKQVAGIIRTNGGRRFSGQAFPREAKIADSSRGFGLSAGTDRKARGHCQRGLHLE